MIEPALTSCPSPAFTPRRWPTLSRPFLELEPAFLWAMSQSSFPVRELRLGAELDVASFLSAVASPAGLAPDGRTVVSVASVFVALVSVAPVFAALVFAALAPGFGVVAGGFAAAPRTGPAALPARPDLPVALSPAVPSPLPP